MATTTKLFIDKATVLQLFKAVVNASDEINEKCVFYGEAKRLLQIQQLAQASEFYVPNGFHDRVALTTNCHPDIRGWSDREWVNTKPGWESLGIASSSLLSGERQDHMGNFYPIPQTMAGVEIDIDSDEFQAWYLEFSIFPPPAIFEGQHKISEILSKYFEDSNRSKRQKQSYYYATELWRDVKIVLMNKLYKTKSTLRSQLSDEICKPITDHKSFVEIRDGIELLISMVEMAFGLPYKQDDHTTAMQFIDAQLERINSQAVFAREQDRLAMIRTLHAAHVDADDGKFLDMEILLNLIGGIFKPDEEAAVDDESLQAALSAQVRKTNYENRGMAMHERKALKKNPEN